MRLILVLLLLTILIAPASAGLSDLDISKVLPALIAQGGNAFMESIADQLYAMAGISNTSQAQAGIALYMGTKSNFIQTKGVQDQKDFNALAYFTVYILFMGYGAARISGEKGEITKGFASQESYRGTYLKYLVLGLVFFIFYLYGLEWMFTGEWLIASGFVMNSMTVLPSNDQFGLSYLLIAIGNIGVWVFMQARDIVVYMVMMFLLWLIVAQRLPIVGYLITMILAYGITLFFSRIVLAFLFMAGSNSIEALGLGGLVIPYLILMIMILVACIILLILPYLVVKSGIMFARGRGSGVVNHHHYGDNGSGSYKYQEILHE